MISKPLFKQSVKANITRWLIVTFASCFIVAVVIMILGNLNVNEIKSSMNDLFETADKEAQIKEESINNYENLNELYKSSIDSFNSTKQIVSISIGTYAKVVNSMGNDGSIAFVKEQINNNILATGGTTEDANKASELGEKAISIFVINQSLSIDEISKQIVSEEVYDNILNEEDEETAKDSKAASEYFISAYINNGNMIEQEKNEMIIKYISNLTYEEAKKEETEEDSKLVMNISEQSIYDYDNMIKNGYSKEDAKVEVSKSLTEQLPETVETAIEEIKDLDVYGLVIGNILYKIAGLLLPIIFVIMTANNLIAGQVDSGSMAYVLSTPTQRKKVAFTQMLYLVSSVVFMYILIALTSVICINIVDSAEFTITTEQILKFNLGALFVMFAISGICYLSSAWFNREKDALSIGGGISILFLVCSILGLFGEEVIPSAIRIETMNYFNYASIITLFDVNSILNGTNTYLYGILVLFAIGIVTYIVGMLRFNHKDLPL